MRTRYFSVVALLTLMFNAWSQNDDAMQMTAIPMTGEDSTKTWITGGGIGLDFGNILVINPKPGAGQNRIGFGGAVGLFANYRKDRLTWDNNGSLNLSMEKTGSGILPIDGVSIRVPFKKSIDDLRLNSTAGYKITPTSKFSYALNGTFRTQLTPSYIGVEDGQVYAKSIQIPGPYQNRLISQIFSPARASVGVGIKYDPTPNLSIIFTPATLDLIMIEDQYIANLGIHGTELHEGFTDQYQRVRVAIGAFLGVNYAKSFFEDRLAWSSRLGLFSDYEDQPQNVDIDFTNEVAIALFKNVQLAYLSNLYYDDDTYSYVTDFDAVGGLELDALGNPVLRQIVNYYHQIVVRYTRVF